MAERAAALGLQIALHTVSPRTAPGKHIPGHLHILPLDTQADVVCGKADRENAEFALESIRIATRGCLAGDFDAMVTPPVNKAVINDAGHTFSGHTEFIAGICGVTDPVMMLINQELRVALVTTHLPLSRVSRQITATRLERVIRIATAELTQRFGIKNPQLLVCGLNPHAGEQGHLGNEEIRTIIPTLDRLRRGGLRLTGPVPADTAFTPGSLRDIDLVIAMYHDQGLPVLKSRGFGETVNITLGLPIIRTSVDHGSALALAGSGRASPDSLAAALQQAISLANTRRAGAG